jgi:hypothetical protein
MGSLRRQRLLLSWLVITAIIGSSIAKAHCWSFLSSDTAPISGIAHAHCDHGPDANSADKDAPAQKRLSDCPVCMALAVAVIGDAGGVMAGAVHVRLELNALRPSIPPQAALLRLGGLGSRAPPLLV